MAHDACDVIIIGAGIIGGSIAWRLRQAGVAVALFDAGVLGGEASWAGAGMLAPGGELVARSRWADYALQSLAMYPAFVTELAGESGVKIDYRRCGAMEFARSEEDWQELRARRALQEPLGIRSEVLADGLFYPDDAAVDPREVIQALRRCCEKRNVSIRERTPVLEVRIVAGGVEIQTGAGAVAARAAVVAAGAWSGDIPVTRNGEHIATPGTFPVRGALLGYAMEPGSLGPILRHGHAYVMQRSNGFTIAGASSEQVGFNRELSPRTIADIQAKARELLPALATVPLTDAWQGFRPATSDFEPAIRQIEGDPVWLAYGHYRNGILLAPATAAQLASEITASLGKG